jgi:predicted enzyme related to lactoylglutathione lyase
MYFVENPVTVATWWARAMGTDAHHEGEFSFIDVGDLEIGFHPSDDARNPPGSSTVAYFQVDDLEAKRSNFLALGCSMHRGPLVISPTRSIAQLVDPFGNVFGLDGPLHMTR